MKFQTLQTGSERLTQPLVELSARIGCDPMFVQGGTGNTSIKADNVMWVKASGKWLADAAREDVMVPVEWAAIRDAVGCNRHLPVARASIETAMHAVIPHRVVLHVHGVNTIAWAVRVDGAERVGARLSGLRWAWIPYVASGLPLAVEIQEVFARDPDIKVLILGNHGLVVCGEDCTSAESLLREVEWRLRLPVRRGCGSNVSAVEGWRLPDCPSLHDLATDPVSRAILARGVLYPCHGIFLCADESGRAPFRIIGECGVLVNETITPAEQAILMGLVHVVQRIEDPDSVRYLTNEELAALMNADAYSYRSMAGHGLYR